MTTTHTADALTATTTARLADEQMIEPMIAWRAPRWAKMGRQLVVTIDMEELEAEVEDLARRHGQPLRIRAFEFRSQAELAAIEAGRINTPDHIVKATPTDRGISITTAWA